jgi:hypothetical protein
MGARGALRRCRTFQLAENATTGSVSGLEGIISRQYLGPWGNKRYPIAYGKFHCVAVNTNEKLMANAQTADWVRRTTIKLQEPLRDFVVAQFRTGSLPKLTESELRQYAFSVHPAAYDRGGLAVVTLVAPELIKVIVTIPAVEFDPRSENFGPTVKQIFFAAVRPGF